MLKDFIVIALLALQLLAYVWVGDKILSCSVMPQVPDLLLGIYVYMYFGETLVFNSLEVYRGTCDII